MPLTQGWQGYCLAAAKDLKPLVGEEFDMLVASGISGQCVGFYAAVALKIPLLLVRKEPSKNGAYGIKRTYVDNGEVYAFWLDNKKPPRVCFLDDWIGGGGTRTEVGVLVHNQGGDMLYQYLYAGMNHLGAKYGKMEKSVYSAFGEVSELIRPTPRAPVRKRVRVAAGVKKPIRAGVTIR